MSITKKFFAKSFVRILVVIFVLVIGVFVFNVLSNPYDDNVANFIPYEFIKQFLCYDHIVYEGIPYYWADADVPKEYIPFASEKVYVTLVDSDGEPYDENRKEEARIYQNDEHMTFIYYGSAAFTKDKSLALDYYGFSE